MTTAEIFRASHGQYTDAKSRIDRIKDLTIPELKVILADQEVQLTVRRRAESALRKLAAMASGFPALNREARKSSFRHFVSKALPAIRARRRFFEE